MGSAPAQGFPAKGITHSYQAWGTLPASPSNQQVVHFNDVPFSLIYDEAGATWRAINDPWDLFFFYDKNYLNAGLSLEIGSGSEGVLPTESAVVKSGLSSWTITNSIGELDFQGGLQTVLVFWDLGAPRSEILWISGGIHAGDNFNGANVIIQTSTTHGASVDDGYGISIVSNNFAAGSMFEYTAGASTEIDVISQYTLHGASGNGAESGTVSLAMYYKDSTNEITVFARRSKSQWVEISTATDSTHTTMQSLIYRLFVTAINGYQRIHSPFWAFTG